MIRAEGYVAIGAVETLDDALKDVSAEVAHPLHAITYIDTRTHVSLPPKPRPRLAGPFAQVTVTETPLGRFRVTVVGALTTKEPVRDVKVAPLPSTASTWYE